MRAPQAVCITVSVDIFLVLVLILLVILLVTRRLRRPTQGNATNHAETTGHNTSTLLNAAAADWVDPDVQALRERYGVRSNINRSERRAHLQVDTMSMPTSEVSITYRPVHLSPITSFDEYWTCPESPTTGKTLYLDLRELAIYTPMFPEWDQCYSPCQIDGAERDFRVNCKFAHPDQMDDYNPASDYFEDMNKHLASLRQQSTGKLTDEGFSESISEAEATDDLHRSLFPPGMR